MYTNSCRMLHSQEEEMGQEVGAPGVLYGVPGGRLFEISMRPDVCQLPSEIPLVALLDAIFSRSRTHAILGHGHHTAS